VNGAQALLHTLAGSGVRVCFANPGTSEMHFVAALDSTPGMRGVLCLFEGVATGAADGYGRMTGHPAAVLLHLGPGLGNGLANLHNARRAHTPIVNVVGDHATYHQRHDAPLQSDIAAVAGSVSGWFRSTARAGDVAADGAEAVAAALRSPGGIATLVLPADVSWSPASAPPPSGSPVSRPAPLVSGEVVGAVAAALNGGEPCVLLVGGAATRREGIEAADRIARATGAKLLCETFPARLERGAGIPSVERLSYLGEFAAAQMEGARHVILAGATRPVAFFAYPDKPSDLVPEGCEVHLLADEGEDVTDALERLADLVAKDTEPVARQAARPALPSGALTAETAAAVIGALLPEDAIVADEANTSGLWLAEATAGAPPHDWLTLTGGAIGQGMPLATGAAVACPSRPVVCLESDGSAMYTLQALWTQARESLNVTTVLFDNRAYAILGMELTRTGAAERPGPAARALVDLSGPDLDFVALARGMGVQASRAATVEDFAAQFGTAIAEPGPHLIQVVVPPLG
jgi:acetolactate synthase-1/2/3 large subunit